MLNRTIQTFIVDVVLKQDRKIALVSGPRQVGKTTLSKSIQSAYSQSFYFNWDWEEHRRRFLKDPLFFQTQERNRSEPTLLVLDEIHKYPRWRNYVKGIYDLKRNEFPLLVTGSGRLDLYRKGGDSLAGRTEGAPLMPLTVGELRGDTPSWADFLDHLKDGTLPGEAREAMEGLLQFGGFPEPFLKADTGFYRRWSREWKSTLIRMDLRDALPIRDISMVESLAMLIPECVGSPLSLNSLREDLSVSYDSVRDWTAALERFYFLFRVAPYAGRLRTTLKKEGKAYLFNWADVEDPGARFENMIALHLHKAVHTWNAKGEAEVSLRLVRDKQKREVDFALIEKDRVVCLIECKVGDTALSPHLGYFQERMGGPPAIQLVQRPGVYERREADGGVRWVVSADRWLRCLP